MRTLSEYIELLDAVRRTLIKEAEFNTEPSLEFILNNPRLIMAISHSTPFSIIPAIAQLGFEIHQAGGGNRVPFAIIDKWYYKFPITSMIASYITQFSEPLNFESTLEQLKLEEPRDLVVFPEGANAFFGNSDQIQPFRSNRFVELSILSQAPILICVHKGSEKWSTEMPLPDSVGQSLGQMILPFSKFFGNKILSGEKLSIPQFPTPLPTFKMHCELWLPALYEADLSMEPTERKEQLAIEGEKIRQRMQDIFDELGS